MRGGARRRFSPFLHSYSRPLFRRDVRLRSSVRSISTITTDIKCEGLICSPASPLLEAAEGVSELSSYDSWYRSPKWLRNPHVHTIFASQARKAPFIKFERVLLNTSDGGRIAVDIVADWESRNEEVDIAEVLAKGEAGEDTGRPSASSAASNSPESNRWFLFVSGLGGGSEDSYVQSMCVAAARRGWKVAVLNMRGCGNSPITSPRFFSAMRGSIEDMKETVKYIRSTLARGEKAIVSAGGWSNGATIINNYAALQETDASFDQATERIDLAVTLCCPFDMPLATEAFKRPFSRNVYDRALTMKLVSKLKENMDVFREHEAVSISGRPFDIDLERLLKARTIREIDAELTCKSFDYPDVDSYYADASCNQRLKDIRIPTLMIQALDDPLVPEECIPYDDIVQNENLLLVTTRNGGHLGWVESNRKNSKFPEGVQEGSSEKRWCPEWVENVALNHLDAVLESRSLLKL